MDILWCRGFNAERFPISLALQSGAIFLSADLKPKKKLFLFSPRVIKSVLFFFSFYLFIFFLHFSIFIWRGGLLYLSVARWVCVCFVFGPLRDCSFFMFVWFNEIAHSRILPLHFSLFSSSLILGESCACALFGEAAAAALGSILLILTISCICVRVCV